MDTNEQAQLLARAQGAAELNGYTRPRGAVPLSPTFPNYTVLTISANGAVRTARADDYATAVNLAFAELVNGRAVTAAVTFNHARAGEISQWYIDRRGGATAVARKGGVVWPWDGDR